MGLTAFAGRIERLAGVLPMIEVVIDVEDDWKRTGRIIEWMIVNQSAKRGRMAYLGTDFKKSRFQFSNLIDAIFFKLAWG